MLALGAEESVLPTPPTPPPPADRQFAVQWRDVPEECVLFDLWHVLIWTARFFLLVYLIKLFSSHNTLKACLFLPSLNCLALF